jgi:hypothetical protein
MKIIRTSDLATIFEFPTAGQAYTGTLLGGFEAVQMPWHFDAATADTRHGIGAALIGDGYPKERQIEIEGVIQSTAVDGRAEVWAWLNSLSQAIAACPHQTTPYGLVTSQNGPDYHYRIAAFREIEPEWLDNRTAQIRLAVSLADPFCYYKDRGSATTTMTIATNSKGSTAGGWAAFQAMTVTPDAALVRRIPARYTIEVTSGTLRRFMLQSLGYYWITTYPWMEVGQFEVRHTDAAKFIRLDGETGLFYRREISDSAPTITMMPFWVGGKIPSLVPGAQVVRLTPDFSSYPAQLKFTISWPQPRLI